MIGISVFSDRMIRFSTLKHSENNSHMVRSKRGLDDAFSKQVCHMCPQCSNQIGQYAIVMPPVGRYCSNKALTNNLSTELEPTFRTCA